MMPAKRTLATVVIALTFFGCKGAVQASAASAVANESSSSAEPGEVGKTAGGGGARTEYIKDPTLDNMNAIPVTIPAKWHFQGALFQGGNCTKEPYAVWRTTSPDGLSLAEVMPPLAWVWGTGPMFGFTPKDGCLPLKGPMSAQDFLKYLAATMKVDYVADDPVSAQENASAQKYYQKLEEILTAQHVAHPKRTAEVARASVHSRNGTFSLKGLMMVELVCTESVSAGTQSLSNYSPGHPVHAVTGPPSRVNTCTATVGYLTAPENQFAGMLQQWKAHKMGMADGLNTWASGLSPWETAWSKREIKGVQEWSAENNRIAAGQRQAQQQQFDHNMAVQKQMHEQFLSTMAKGTADSMRRTQENMNARGTATSDWVDYSLDRQTVRDPNTGQVSKVSSSYSHTWVDSTGKTSYQTNDVNANPNGVLPGNWTRQTTVHGDGTQ